MQSALRRVWTLLLLIAQFSSATLAAQDQGPVDLRGRLTRGERITVELKTGHRLSGAVGDRFSDGFYIENPPAPPAFIPYRNVRALHDPDNDAIVLNIADYPDRRWVKPVLITAAIVGVLAVLTHGLFPLCAFRTCN